MKKSAKIRDILNSAEEATVGEKEKVSAWFAELDKAERREKAFRKKGKELENLYEGGDAASSYNILFSNTDTMLPALYGATPRPVVRRRFSEADINGLAASKVAERLLAYLLDTGLGGYDSFDKLFQMTVLSALIPGRGVFYLSYEADVAYDEVGAPAQTKSELVCGKYVAWDRFTHGYGRTWAEVPWISYCEPMTKAEVKTAFGTDALDKLVFNSAESSYENDSEGEDNKADVTWVYQIWDKQSKKVFWVSRDCPDSFLKQTDDPLKLSGFFNCAEPLTFLTSLRSTCPIALYTMYEDQAKELDSLTIRIRNMIKAIKVRGGYNAQVEGLSKLLEADDNVLLPVDNVAAVEQAGGLERALFFVPVEKHVAALQQLFVQRSQIKQVIHEIIGLADIMRGSSAASETLGAQQIKDRWGSLRIKSRQKEVVRFVRESLRLALELAVTHMAQETIASIVNFKLPSEAEKQSLLANSQQNPAMTSQMQLLQSSPTWESVLGLLQNDLQRSFRIDIETNSSVDAEATEDKQNVAEMLNALSQFLNGVGPLVESKQISPEVVKTLTLTVLRRFRMGDEVEEILMRPPEPQAGPKPEELQQQADKLAQEQQALAAQQNALKEERLEFELDKRLAAKELKAEFKQAEKEFQAHVNLTKATEAKAKEINSLLEQEQANQQNETRKQEETSFRTMLPEFAEAIAASLAMALQATSAKCLVPADAAGIIEPMPAVSNLEVM